MADFEQGVTPALYALTVGEGVAITGTWFVEKGTHVDGYHNPNGDELHSITFVDAYGNYVAKVVLKFGPSGIEPDSVQTNVAEI